MTKASIIIVNWNTAQITKKCVTTIRKYLKQDIWEIVLVDNGSTDESRQILPSLVDVYVQNDSNLGFAKGCNIGAKSAHGQYLLFLNSDMELIDSSLSNLLSYFRSDKNIGVIGPQFLNPDLTPQGSVFPPQTAVNAFKEFFLGLPSYSKYVPDTSKPLKVWAVSGGAFLIRTSFFKKVGGWKEQYFMFFEDLDMCREIRRLKKDIVYYPQCRLIHRHGASGQHLASNNNQWRRLIPSSILYHGKFKHSLINSVIWSGQKFTRLLRFFHLKTD